MTWVTLADRYNREVRAQRRARAIAKAAPALLGVIASAAVLAGLLNLTSGAAAAIATQTAQMGGW